MNEPPGKPTEAAVNAFIGARLKEARLGKGVAVEDAAREIDVTSCGLRDAEEGGASLSPTQLVRLCDLYGVPVSTMFESTFDPATLGIEDDERSRELMAILLALATDTSGELRARMLKLIRQ